MNPLAAGALVFLVLASPAGAAPAIEGRPLREFQSAQIQMGVEFKIVLYAPDEAVATRGFQAAFARIEALNRIFSDYDSASEIGRLCDQAPTTSPVPVSDDLWQVLVKAQALSRQTDGAFDVTVGPLTKLWRRARRQAEMIPADRLAEARAAVGYQHLRLVPEKQAVELLRPGMRIDLGGIAKGYAADAALAELRKLGLNRALVNGSGDISIGAPPPDARGWKIGIAPLAADGPPSRFLLLAHCAVATSGDAWQHVVIDGRRYSHILDPHTGLGLSDRSSVTIIAPDGTAADSLASAVSVLGPQRGLALVEKLPGAFALIVRAPDDRVQTHISRGFDDLPHAQP